MDDIHKFLGSFLSALETCPMSANSIFTPPQTIAQIQCSPLTSQNVSAGALFFPILFDNSDISTKNGEQNKWYFKELTVGGGLRTFIH